MKLLIGIATAESARMAAFYDYLHFLRKPEGTLRISFHTNSGARNRNLIIDDALANNCSHILFLDDDMAFGPDALMRLIRHDKDIISGLYLNRNHPHSPVIFDYASLEEGMCSRRPLREGESGLIEVEAAGFGFLLVKTDIFKFMEPPYVRTGEFHKDRRSEDISFCCRARKIGIRIYCDLDCRIGHIGQMIVWPSTDDKGVWQTGIDTHNSKIWNTTEQELIEG